MKALAAAVFGLALLLGAAGAPAVQPDEVLDDPALEARARAIGQNLRCVVCQNQTIDESDAELARDLRVLVRQRLLAGDSDRQVLNYAVSRYGDFVLLSPPVKDETFLLWFAPALLTVGASVGVWLYLRRQRRLAEPSPLDANERARLAKVLAGPDGDGAR